MKKIILLFLFSYLGLFLVKAQDTLSVDSTTYFNIQDSVNYGSTSVYDVIINISGSTPYTGNIYLIYGVDSTSGVQSLDTLIRTVVNKFNDTIVFSVSETYDNINGYRLGGNVVVIWPVASSLVTRDTLYKDVYVHEFVGVNEKIELYRQFTVYPNPTKDALYITNNSLNERGERVRISDVNGRLICDDEYKSKINISNLSDGIYFLNIVLKTGDILYYKIIKE